MCGRPTTGSVSNVVIEKQAVLLYKRTLSPILNALYVDFVVFFYCARHSPKCWYAFMGHRLCRQTCLAPEEFKKSKSGPWPKKVVHHWSRLRVVARNNFGLFGIRGFPVIFSVGLY